MWIKIFRIYQKTDNGNTGTQNGNYGRTNIATREKK